MKCGVAAFVVLVALPVVSGRSTVTPVQKVIDMMNGMLENGKKERHDEQVQFAAYKQFCDDTSAEKTRGIAAAAEQIEILTADIQKYTQDIDTLTKEVAQHDADIADDKDEQDAATKVRETEKADFDTLEKDYSESVDALERAIIVLKKQSYDRKQASSLVQVSNLKKMNLIPKQAKKAIDAFLELGQDPEGIAVSAPEANGYEFQSSHIVDMLQGLHDKFAEELNDLQQKEGNAVHAYGMLMADLTDQITVAEADRSEKTDFKAKAKRDKASAEGSLADTASMKKADEKYLADLTATCASKSADFESRQQLRAEELEAIEKAIEIISSGAVSGAANKHLPAMLQTSLAQLRTDVRSPAQQRAAEYLQMQGKRLNSQVLAALAAHAAADPFQKVKKMIKELVVRLVDEANEESNHKGFCDQELAINSQSRQEKSEAVEMLQAEIDQLKASNAKLIEEIAQAEAAVADLATAMKQATTLRQDEKEKNQATINDAQEAQVAVASAVTVLTEFYEKAGEATALLQQKQKQPEIFDSPYQGMQAENGGIIGMLEVIQSDFSKLEADTEAAEAASEKEYVQFMRDSEVDKASKEGDIKHKTTKKEDQSLMLTRKDADLDGAQKELDAALAYYDKLKPSCVDSGVSYEDRVAGRKEEIESLQEALKILSGEELA